MTPQNFHALQTSLLTLPVAMVYTRHLLQSQRPLATVTTCSLNAQRKLIRWRASSLTETLKNIHGYDHHGINE